MRIVVLALMSAALFGCRSAAPSGPAEPPAQVQRRLESGLCTVRSAEPQLAELDAELLDLRRLGGWTERGYLSAEESDRLEMLLFRFVAVHTALWDVVRAAHDPNATYANDLQKARVHVVAERAALLLASHSSFWVAEFYSDPVAVADMNEAHPRSELPRDTYRELRESITRRRLERLRAASELATEQLADPGSALARLVASDAVFASFVEHNRDLEATAEFRLEAAVPARSESEVARASGDALHDIGEWFGDGLYAVRALLFKDVSRLKSPSAHIAVFTAEQKSEVLARLQLGDLVLTYTAGYVSDVFIPGAFKHGITFVGTPDQRSAAGLSPEVLPEDERFDLGRVTAHLAQGTLPDGGNANAIEAVAEGVIFSDLEHIMETHVNRMLVLRPRLTPEERAAFVVEVFTYLGEDYDFRFDFADSSRQVCTEVIHRALDGKGGIAFVLTERGGHETLSADDVAAYFLRAGAFDLVLYAEDDPGRDDHAARILTGPAARTRLEELLSSPD